MQLVEGRSGFHCQAIAIVVKVLVMERMKIYFKMQKGMTRMRGKGMKRKGDKRY